MEFAPELRATEYYISHSARPRIAAGKIGRRATIKVKREKKVRADKRVCKGEGERRNGKSKIG